MRHVEAGHELSDVDCVRAIVAAHNAVEEKEMNSWEMTESGTPFYKCLGNSFVDPRPVWGMYWRYRTTLIRVHPGEDRNWLLVELSQLYMDREDPFEPVEECMIKMGGLECEILTLLGKHEHGVEQIGVLVDESDDFIGGEGQEQPHFADVVELPPGLAKGPQGGDEAAPMEFIEAEEFPEEQVYLYDDFVITKNSRILDSVQATFWTPCPLLECSPCILAVQPVPHPLHYQNHAFSGGTWQALPRSHHLLRAESFRIDGSWQQI